jgi:hypothetical protein
MPLTNGQTAAGMAPQPATNLTLARTTLTASSDEMPRAAWRVYSNIVRQTAQELRDMIGSQQEPREGMSGPVREEGTVLRRDFDAAVRVIDSFEALEDILEDYERVVRTLYERGHDYMGNRIRLGLRMYNEGDEHEPEYEGEAQLARADKGYRWMESSKSFLGRLAKDLEELKEQRPDVVMAKI